MAKKKKAIQESPAAPAAKPSSLLDTRVIYCGDNLEQLQKLPDRSVGLIYIDPPFNSNRNYEVFWGETKEKRAFEDRHASTQAQVGDMGIDGRIYPLSAAPKKKAGELDFMDAWYPIQVKQKDKVGRPDIDAFEAAMIRENREKGFFVSFDFSSAAISEIQAFFKNTGKSIIPLTVKDIFEEQIAFKLA